MWIQTEKNWKIIIQEKAFPLLNEVKLDCYTDIGNDK